MKPKLLLHACCAPCLSSAEEQLRNSFEVDVFWYNPNIYPSDEYRKRLLEVERYTKIIKQNLLVRDSKPDDLKRWEASVVDFAGCPEGSRRCRECIFFRLEASARQAKVAGYDYFATTLTVSPRKNAILVNRVGSELAHKVGINFLEADFKKRDGYLRSLQLSKEYNLYRQNYCGCRFSCKRSPSYCTADLIRKYCRWVKTSRNTTIGLI